MQNTNFQSVYRLIDKYIFQPFGKGAKKALGTAALMVCIHTLSAVSGVKVLLPPLAATCFIHSFCSHLPVSRPKASIAGHFIAALCGLFANWFGDFLPDISCLSFPVKLVLAMFLSSTLMKGFDVDHPPAAATAIFPIIAHLPMELYAFPLHMAWGASISVYCSLIWNHFKPDLNKGDVKCFAALSDASLSKLDKLGLLICLSGFILICALPLFPLLYIIGLGITLVGVVMLGILNVYPKHNQA